MHEITIIRVIDCLFKLREPKTRALTFHALFNASLAVQVRHEVRRFHHYTFKCKRILLRNEHPSYTLDRARKRCDDSFKATSMIPPRH